MNENTDKLFLLLENKELKAENEELKAEIKRLKDRVYIDPVKSVYMKKQFLDIRFLDDKLVKEFFGILDIPSKICEDFFYSYKINRNVMQQLAFNISCSLWNDLYQDWQKVCPDLPKNQDILYKKFEKRIIEEKDYEGDRRIWKRVCNPLNGSGTGRGRPKTDKF
jgi:hypothetical protein